jgi:DNA processing protein
VDGIGSESAAIIRRWQDHADPVAEAERARGMGVSIVFADDPLFPAPLREVYDAPLLLYVWGRLEAADRHALAVVGSRRLTHYGRQVTHKFAFQLARAGFVIVSGLARGIDTAAHEAAIAAEGRTIAVVGSGLAKLYPPENFGLAEKIAGGYGAVVTEFPLDTAPDKQTFPMRNRIVAAWGRAVLVAESPAWSGSLITANLAADYGRPVFAIPGPVDRPSSAGCHQLIRNGATLVTDPGEILDDLGELPLGLAGPAGKAVPDEIPALPPDEAAVLAAVSDDQAPVDRIIEITGLPAPVVTATLLKLEMRRLVRQLPGFRFVRR